MLRSKDIIHLLWFLRNYIVFAIIKIHKCLRQRITQVEVEEYMNIFHNNAIITFQEPFKVFTKSLLNKRENNIFIFI